ncbi:hypothetical protein IQ255_09030 [Pleurocapsales cyanobacterium LEGE 10410]|nr:hypothetical protein [Pleurocapsales cyanobacterium LEGE 10410]
MNKEDEKYLVIKADIPRDLKLKFKVLCTQKELTMSEVIKELIKKWIQANKPISNFIFVPSEEDYENVKGYIPKSLKTQFKVFCTRKRVTMCSVLYNLINEWVKAETER